VLYLRLFFTILFLPACHIQIVSCQRLKGSRLYHIRREGILHRPNRKKLKRVEIITVERISFTISFSYSLMAIDFKVRNLERPTFAVGVEGRFHKTRSRGLLYLLLDVCSDRHRAVVLCWAESSSMMAIIADNRKPCVQQRG
jgi:hypothetical protein